MDQDYLLGDKAISRSLILFNALFALQTGLNLVYLLGVTALPDGMSHAEYAHRGVDFTADIAVTREVIHGLGDE